MFFRKIRQKLFGFAVLGFVAGLFLAFVLPPIVIVIVEGILLAIMCWCFYCM